MVSNHKGSRTLLWLSRRGGATTHDFLGAQPKIWSHMRQLVVNFEPWFLGLGALFVLYTWQIMKTLVNSAWSPTR